MNKACTKVCRSIAVTFLVAQFMCLPIGAQVSKDVLDSISTPNQVETSIGTLKFLDGAPYPETADKVYDYLDTMRGVDAFLKGMPGASLQGLIKGSHEVGAVKYNQVLVFDKLMDSKSLFLTGNTSTMYVVPDFDLEMTGPMLRPPLGCWVLSTTRGFAICRTLDRPDPRVRAASI